MRATASWLSLLLVGAACKRESAPPAAAPAPAPQAPNQPPWFGPRSGDDDGAPDRAAEVLELRDAHFSEYPGLRAPAPPASEVELSWELRKRASLDARGGEGSEYAEHCLNYAIPGVGRALYADFAEAARARGDEVRETETSIDWERSPGGDESRRQSATLIEEGRQLRATWCTRLPAAAARTAIGEWLESDWRFVPAREFSSLVEAPPRALGYGQVRGDTHAWARFIVDDPDQVDPTFQWLRAHDLRTDATQARWSGKVPDAWIEVEVSDASMLPLQVELRVQTTPPEVHFPQ